VATVNPSTTSRSTAYTPPVASPRHPGGGRALRRASVNIAIAGCQSSPPSRAPLFVAPRRSSFRMSSFPSAVFCIGLAALNPPTDISSSPLFCHSSPIHGQILYYDTFVMPSSSYLQFSIYRLLLLLILFLTLYHSFHFPRSQSHGLVLPSLFSGDSVNSSSYQIARPCLPPGGLPPRLFPPFRRLSFPLSDLLSPFFQTAPLNAAR